MIDPRELRIGNLLLHKDGFIMEIDSINELEVRGNELGKNDPDDEIEVSLINLSGVPLTEERLVKFGYYHEGKVSSRIKISSEYGEIIIYFKDIKYVHTYQNLIFALTGTELELKEEVKK